MTKTRISLSINKELINEIDSRVDGIYIRSRSDTIEKILKEHVVNRKTAVILAGGDPKKLFVKELNTYRPLIQLGSNKLIEHAIIKCRSSNFVNIIIAGSTTIISKLYEVLGNGDKYGVNIIYIEEKDTLGSGKTLELVKDFIKTDFLFMPCDHYFDFDLKKIHEFHLEHNGTATLAIYNGTNVNSNKGVVEMDGYKIIDYEEIPKNKKTNLISAMIGFMKKDIFNLIPPGNVNWNLQHNIFPKLAKEGKLVGYPVSGNWANIHTTKDIEKIIDSV